MTQRAETGPLQARLARLARAGGEAAAALAADIAAELPDGRAEAVPTPTGAAVAVEAKGLVAREFGTATRMPRPVIGPAVARLAEPG
ncbi:hypothetical protein PUR29_23085 [Methylobacterium ajmalii]|uniref:Uncharacterized protein n=1 Tax=Methylobacterium ajmalii TaxID=2738439 RepID=A0ABU9ZY12_9HYPH